MFINGKNPLEKETEIMSTICLVSLIKSRILNLFFYATDICNTSGDEYNLKNCNSIHNFFYQAPNFVADLLSSRLKIEYI